jgi:hypothetical protein
VNDAQRVYHRAMRSRGATGLPVLHSNEGSPREPVHVHVRGATAKQFWVRPSVADAMASTRTQGTGAGG